MPSRLYTQTLLPLTIAVCSTAFADQVINDDLVVGGSVCVGLDCNNGESFGFDTLRLKENNLRIKFEGTSSSASFPSNDWQLTANDTSNGGANKFSIDDVTGGKTPFTVEAGTPSNTLYVDSTGRIGVKTNAPVVDIHVKEGNTPTLRLEQDGSSGFTPQVWDLAGNETNFFIRDVTNGSKLPFRIKPGAPKNAIFVDSDGDIGLGTETPDAQLHVVGQGLLISDKDSGVPANGLKYLHVVGEDGAVHIERNSEVDQATTMFNMTNNGVSRFEWNNSATGNQWKMTNFDDDFYLISPQTSGTVLILTKTGDLTILGSLTAAGINYPSSRALKENFLNIDLSHVLDQVVKLDISQWNYITDSDSKTHIGPIAEEFHQAFGLNGDNDAVISTSDIAGVSLAAIKALKLQLDESNKEIARLKKLIED